MSVSSISLCAAAITDEQLEQIVNYVDDATTLDKCQSLIDQLLAVDGVEHDSLYAQLLYLQTLCYTNGGDFANSNRLLLDMRTRMERGDFKDRCASL